MWVELDLSSEEFKTKQFPSIDVMKLLCSILVVIIHTSPLSSINNYFDYLINCVARLAVPFFFISSGYFCFRKTKLESFDKKIPMSYAKKMFTLYIIWTTIYLPQLCYNTCKCEKGILYGFLHNIRIVIFSGFHHLWYLKATAIAVIVITIALHKKIRLEKVLLMGGYYMQ